MVSRGRGGGGVEVWGHRPAAEREAGGGSGEEGVSGGALFAGGALAEGDGGDLQLQREPDDPRLPGGDEAAGASELRSDRGGRRGDGTGEIAGDDECPVIRTENRGLSNARNRGWQEASGDIVAYIDDDAY